MSEKEVFNAFSRIINGYVKIVFVSALFFSLHGRLAAALEATGDGRGMMELAALYVAAGAAFTIYFYYNFAGYMDVIIGFGRMMGFDPPENFNKPFAARNFLEFWSRWHITLSDWFRFYMFNPLLKSMIGIWGNPRAANYLGVVAFFATFLVLGVWHGATDVFFVYGLFLGAGVSLNKLYQVLAAKQLGKDGYKRLSENPLYIYLCRGVTFTYFSVALTGLWVDMAGLTRIAGMLGPDARAGAITGTFIVAAASEFWLERSRARMVGLEWRFRCVYEDLAARNAWLAVKALLVISFAIISVAAAPEITYKAF